MENSPVLNKSENKWMKSVIQVVRNTSLFFQPQIRTKIMNEGWASYWHETLFLQDDRIKGHEVDFARVNAFVTSLPRVGLNPYSLGMRLFSYIEDLADRGKYSYDFQRLLNQTDREAFDRQTGRGRDFIFAVRENMSDFLFLNTFLDQDFINRHKLFVAGRRMNDKKMVWEYFIKSRKVEEYRRMLMESLYHPPFIELDLEKTEEDGALYLNHRFEEKPLVADYIANTLVGVEFLWGAPVKLETSEVESIKPVMVADGDEVQASDELDIMWRRVLYTMADRKLMKKSV